MSLGILLCLFFTIRIVGSWKDILIIFGHFEGRRVNDHSRLALICFVQGFNLTPVFAQERFNVLFIGILGQVFLSIFQALLINFVRDNNRKSWMVVMNDFVNLL